MANVLVVGFGSIGSRHARLAAELGARVLVVSRREIDWPERIPTLSDAIAATSIDYAIIATETADHWSSLRILRSLGFSGPVLVEKPLADRIPDSTETSQIHPDKVWVAYNLRFHPALQNLKKAAAGSRAINLAVYAGQDLRTWRPGRDTNKAYSASKERGGGVLRDLSHELDYVGWIFGRWKALTACGGHLGPLEISADDSWGILMVCEHCAIASIQLDYYHHTGARTIIANLENDTITVDLTRATYTDSHQQLSWTVTRDATYRAQLEAFLGHAPADYLCSFNEGMDTVKTIEAIARASAAQSWTRQ